MTFPRDTNMQVVENLFIEKQLPPPLGKAPQEIIPETQLNGYNHNRGNIYNAYFLGTMERGDKRGD